MDIRRLNEIVAESMNTVLNEALSIQCQVGYVKISGEHGIISSLDEMLKNIAKQIVNEIKKWGIKKVML